MADKQNIDRQLDDFFAAARDAAPPPSEGLMARIIADAAAEMPVAGARAPVRRGARAARFVAGIGGWPALAGMTAAAAVGLWIGYSAPGAVGTFAADLWPQGGTGYDVVDLMPSIESFLTENGA